MNGDTLGDDTNSADTAGAIAGLVIVLGGLLSAAFILMLMVGLAGAVV